MFLANHSGPFSYPSIKIDVIFSIKKLAATTKKKKKKNLKMGVHGGLRYLKPRICELLCI